VAFWKGIGEKKEEVIKLNKFDRLIKAIKSNDIDAINKCFSPSRGGVIKGMHVNARTECNDTPLIYAIAEGKQEIVDLLIDKGADMNVENDNGFSPLAGALRNGHVEIAHLLINRGAAIDFKNKFGDTPLIWASDCGELAMVKLLLSKGADVNAKNKNEDNSLIIASQRGFGEIVALLIEKGADVNAKNNSGNTALMAASQHGHQTVAKLLIAQGADVNARNSDEDSSFHALENTHAAVAEVLVEHGADIHAENKRGYTPIDIAVKKEIAQAVTLLSAKGAKETLRGTCPDCGLSMPLKYSKTRTQTWDYTTATFYYCPMCYSGDERTPHDSYRGRLKDKNGQVISTQTDGGQWGNYNNIP
jgi:ankyrin repeat protein